MSNTSDGLAPVEWQYGGRLGPAPPVVLARKDQVPFSKHDFELILEYLNTYIMHFLDFFDKFTVHCCLLYQGLWMMSASMSKGSFSKMSLNILTGDCELFLGYHLCSEVLDFPGI